MAPYPVLDRQTALERLRRPIFNPFLVHEEEEEAHPWQVQPHQIFEGPLLRVWDKNSGSEPENDGSMRSRAPDMRLDDRESRRTSLSIHSAYIWEPTPYISFTTSDGRVEELLAMRKKKGPHTITVIDPNVRVKKWLPILHAKTEMDHYEIEGPYGRYGQYYDNEYLCLWQVTAAEIVGHWAWNDLQNDEDWYKNIILPEFQRFTETAAAGGATGEVDRTNELQRMLANLSITRHTPRHTNRSIFVGFADDDTDDDEHYWDTDDEGIVANEIHDNYDGWDTDDEVEEAHIADDITRFIEENY
ncbi:hypothetical protein F5Y08DRAFT_93078 [Xylaria arbuscula]|nr:hypothetical protein F5Y08DRAFT_93078 [Xylaria arbuscula]